jgi:minor histocompatibility antigen H13
MSAASASSSSSNSTGSKNPLVLLSYALIVGLWVASQYVFVPYVVHLLVLVTAILYVACHNSLELLEEADEMDENGNPTGAPAPRETLRTEDAYQFPLVGSLTLFSLYLAFKYLGKDLVNLLIGGYFGLVGMGALTLTLSPFIGMVTPQPFQKQRGWKKRINHPLPDMILPSPLEVSVDFTLADVVAGVVSAGVVYLYFQERHWTLNNILGIVFCLQGIEKFSLGTYKIAAILLSGLFLYDIFWVFGTDVMVTVAKNLNGPIKILFPRSLIPNEETGKLDLSLLGLGDIVIPGFFLALLLRFDAHMAKIDTKNINIHASFPKPYFHTALFAYFCGLATTLFVMIQFNAAQPALLYLVPACLGSSFLCATVKGQVKELLDYSEEEDEEAEPEEEDKEETKKEK